MIHHISNFRCLFCISCRDRAKYKADFKNCMVEQHRTRGANLDPVFGLAMSGHNLDENDHDSYHAGDQTHCMNKVEKDIAKTCILSQDILCLGNAKKSAIRYLNLCKWFLTDGPKCSFRL